MQQKEPVKPQQSEGFLGFGASEINAGKTIADAIYAHTAAKQTSEALAQHSKDVETLTKLYQSQKSKGKDTSHTLNLLNQMLQESATGNVPGGDTAEITPSVNKSTEQIAGEFGGVLGDVLTLTTGMPVAAAGAVFGLTHAMQQDSSLAGTAVETAASALGGKILEYGFGKFAPAIAKMAEKYGAPFIEKIAQHIPESAQKAFSNTVSKAVQGGEELARKLTLGKGTAGTDIVNKAGQAFDKPLDKALSATEGAAKGAYAKISKAFSSKTEAEVMGTPISKAHLLSSTEREYYFNKKKSDILQQADRPNLSEEEVLRTPEDKVHTLSDAERNLYFDTKRAEISGATAEEKAKISSEYNKAKEQASIEKDAAIKKIEQEQAKAEDDAKSAYVEQKAKAEDDLAKSQRELDVASRDKVLELRPKLLKGMKEQSQTYGRIVDEQLAPVRGMKIDNAELGSFIDQRYAADPEQAAALKDKLGVVNFPEDMPPAKRKLAELNGDTETTVEDIYRKSKELRKGISSTSVKGSKTYSYEEKQIDDAVNTLTDFLDSKGVDLSEARDFWSKYAPVRDQIIKEAKPFNKAATKTEQFAKTLTDVAKGKDVNNENFISEVEKIVGEPIMDEQKAILQKMSDIEKKKLAAKIESESKVSDAKFSAESAKEEAVAAKSASEKAAKENKELQENRASLEQQRKSGEIDSNEFEARKKSLDEKDAVDKSNAQKIEELKAQKLSVEQKAARRKIVKRLIQAAVTTGVGIEAYKLL